jgi:hypothetical protein
VVYDGGHPAEQCLLVDLADDEAVVRSSITARSAQPRATIARRSCARIASMATRATSVDVSMGMLPKPTYTGGVPASRNATDSAGSGG